MLVKELSDAWMVQQKEDHGGRRENKECEQPTVGVHFGSVFSARGLELLQFPFVFKETFAFADPWRSRLIF